MYDCIASTRTFTSWHCALDYEALPPISGQTVKVRAIPILVVSYSLYNVIAKTNNVTFLTPDQNPKYTFSRKTKQALDVEGNTKHGIGWSDNGIGNYNKMYDRVAADRALRGAVFNNELLNAFRERHSQRRRKRPDQEQRVGKKQ